MTCMTDLKNEDNSIHSSALPGFSFEDLKFSISDFGAISDENVKIFGSTFKANYWIENLDVFKGKTYGVWENYSGINYLAYISSSDESKYYVSSVFGRDFCI